MNISVTYIENDTAFLVRSWSPGAFYEEDLDYLSVKWEGDITSPFEPEYGED